MTLVPSGEANLVADLREIFDAVRKDYRIREKAASAPMPILRAASVMARRSGLESSLLAEELRLERSTVSNLLRDMQGRGLIRRHRLRSDRRYVSLELTGRGHALLLRARKAGNGLLARAIDRLSEDQRLRLALALGPLLLAIRNDQPMATRSRSLRGRRRAV